MKKEPKSKKGLLILVVLILIGAFILYQVGYEVGKTLAHIENSSSE